MTPATLSTHVLDTARGRPAQGVAVRLLHGEREIAAGATDADGRLRFGDALAAGRYQLVFATGGPFFPRVTIEFEIAAGGGSHYHVPLLLSPYGYSTYRGS
jgi:5-hydroxyisourate hydrolase